MKNRRTWTTKDYRTINISDMTDEHLFNTFRLLYRQGSNRRSLDYSNILDECYKRKMKPVNRLSLAEKMEHQDNKDGWNSEQQIFSEIIESNCYDS